MSRTNEVKQALSYVRDGIEGGCLVDYKHKGTISWTLDTLAAEVERLRAALEDHLKLAEKQVEFYKDRVDSGEEHLRPFGSEAWRRVTSLKAALNGEEASA